MRASESPFGSFKSKRILFYASLLCSSVSGHKALKKKKTCLRFAIFNFSEKLQNILEIGFKKCGVIVQKLLSEKKYFKRKNSKITFCCLYLKLATVPLSEKLIQENSAKNSTIHFIAKILVQFDSQLYKL